MKYRKEDCFVSKTQKQLKACIIHLSTFTPDPPYVLSAPDHRCHLSDRVKRHKMERHRLLAHGGTKQPSDGSKVQMVLLQQGERRRGEDRREEGRNRGQIKWQP